MPDQIHSHRPYRQPGRAALLLVILSVALIVLLTMSVDRSVPASSGHTPTIDSVTARLLLENPAP